MPALTQETVEAISHKLAAELAAELSPPEDVIARYGLTIAQFAQIAKNPQFKQILAEAKSIWQSDSNAKERIQAKAAHIVEDAMLEMSQIVHDRSKPVTARIDGFKHLSKMAKVDGGRDDALVDVGSKFSIVINLGDDPADKVVVDAPAIDPSQGDSIEDIL